MTTQTAKRFYVNAMHKPSNGFDGPTQVDYWRVSDRQTGCRADRTPTFETAVDAQVLCDALNRADAMAGHYETVVC